MHTMDHVLLNHRFIYLLVAFTVVFALREFCSYKRIRTLKYILTPLITVTIILFVPLSVVGTGFSDYHFFIMMALVLGLAGDVMLMIEESDYFNYGLVFFLLGHASYVMAFSLDFRPAFWSPVFLLALAIINAAFAVIVKKASASAYGVVLSLMVFFAFSRLGNHMDEKGLLIIIGATLFFLSDLVLAVNAFVKRIPNSTVFTWALYAPAQLSIALSCYFN